MHRMHRHAFMAALTVLTCAGVSTPTEAALLRPNDAREYPDITAFANGYQKYTYDSGSQTGVFQLSNVPFLLTNGQTPGGSGFIESNVTPTADNVRLQTITAVLDSQGNLVASPLNSFQIYGTVVVGDQTYTGLLLSGTPTAFGSQSLKPVGVQNEDLFDLSLKITGGSLQSLYGPDAYVRVTSEANSTFNGVFTTDFSSEKVLTNTHTIANLVPSPVPEPTALVVLLACGAGLLYRGRRRIASSDLAARSLTGPVLDGSIAWTNVEAFPAPSPPGERIGVRVRVRPPDPELADSIPARRATSLTPGPTPSRRGEADLAGGGDRDAQSARKVAESLPSASFSIWRTRSRVRPSDSPISLRVLGGASLRPNRIRRTVASRLSISSSRVQDQPEVVGLDHLDVGGLGPLVHQHLAQAPAVLGLVGLRDEVVDLDRLLDDRQLLLGQLEGLGDLLDRGRPAEHVLDVGGHPPPLAEQLDHIGGNPDRLGPCSPGPA